jgi:hypothetical protein
VRNLDNLVLYQPYQLLYQFKVTKKMGRPFNFPDPRNVTLGNPTFLASKDLVVALYNQENQNNAVTNYCQRARDWFISEAHSIGWTTAIEAGNNLGILLHFNIVPPSIGSTPGTSFPVLN